MPFTEKLTRNIVTCCLVFFDGIGLSGYILELKCKELYLYQ